MRCITTVPAPRFFLNNGLLLAFSVLFTLVVYLVARRQRYASL
jgi:hypothetical protein